MDLNMFFFQASIQTVILSLEPETFDDQYNGCQKETEEKLNFDKVLEQELNINSNFKFQWEIATNVWHLKKAALMAELPVGFKDNHGIAVVAYTGSIYRELNAALRSVGRSQEYYMNNFHFKALHYYLTVALQLLSNNCRNVGQQVVYRGVSNIYFKPAPNAAYIRFGQFTSTSKSIYAAQGFGTTSFFTLTISCAVPIVKFSQFPSEDEVLVGGNELFSVTHFDENSHHFYLASTDRTSSYFNCVYIGNGRQDTNEESSFESGNGWQGNNGESSTDHDQSWNYEDPTVTGFGDYSY
ncbi:ecto-ADP-ribosyltransferase 5-like [Discoglossus pictus]